MGRNVVKKTKQDKTKQIKPNNPQISIQKYIYIYIYIYINSTVDAISEIIEIVSDKLESLQKCTIILIVL